MVPNEGDAALVMYQNRGNGKQFDVVDIDPYGNTHPALAPSLPHAHRCIRTIAWLFIGASSDPCGVCGVPGSASIFLDSAVSPSTFFLCCFEPDPAHGVGQVQAVEDGGLLAVTCTDKAVLCGNHSEVLLCVSVCVSCWPSHAFLSCLFWQNFNQS